MAYYDGFDLVKIRTFRSRSQQRETGVGVTLKPLWLGFLNTLKNALGTHREEVCRSSLPRWISSSHLIVGLGNAIHNALKIQLFDL